MHAFRARPVRAASGGLALLAMALVVVAGMLHVTHAMAANAPRLLDPHAHCAAPDATAQELPGARGHGPGDHEPGFGHCPACALAKALALAPVDVAAGLPAPRARCVSSNRRARARSRTRRPEIAARPRAPPRLR